MIYTDIADPIPAGSTRQLKFLLTDVDETTALLNLGSVLTSCVLTHVERTTGKVVNGATARNVLNTGGGTAYATVQTDAAGNQYNLLIELAPADTAIITGGSSETHLAKVTWGWNVSPARVGEAGASFVVQRF